MTNRPTTTTARSANFQASNALSPLLRMQHSALRRRTTPAVMRHRVEAAKSSAAPRPPAPPTAQTVTGLSEPFFCFSAASGRPLCRFCRRVAAITVGTATATAQQAQRNNPFGSRPSRCLRCEQPRPKTTPRRPSIAKQTRSAAGKKGASDGNTPTFSRLSATFSSKSPCTAQCAPATPTISPPHSDFAGKTPSALTFFAYRFASLAIPPYLCADTCPQNFAPSVVKWPWLGFFSSPCCRNWW